MSYHITNVQTLEEMSLGPGQYYLNDAKNRRKTVAYLRALNVFFI